MNGDEAERLELSRAWLRFRRTGVARGIVIGLGFMSSVEVRRREILDPALAHAGPDAIQRMADAVAVGADPLRFAFAPPIKAA